MRAMMPERLRTIGYNARFPCKFEMVFRNGEKAETGRLKLESRTRRRGSRSVDQPQVDPEGVRRPGGRESTRKPEHPRDSGPPWKGKSSV